MMTEKRMSVSYQPVKSYFPERNLRNEVSAALTYIAHSANDIVTSKIKKPLAETHRNYSEERFISRIVGRIFS